MALRNWRWWHWIFVSLVVGGVLGLAFNLQAADDPSLPSTPFIDMRARIERRTDSGDSIITRIRVSPIVDDHNGHPVQAVTYWERMKNRNTGQWDPVRQFRTVTSVPLSPGSPRKDFGVMDFLADKKKAIPSLDYSFEWWLVPRNLWLLSLGGSVLVIGVIWPMVMKSLVKLGLADPPDERMDLSQVRQVETESAVHAAPVASAADQRRLADLNEALAANVAGMTVANASDVKRPAVPEPVRLLNAAPADASPASAETKKPDDFKGEFYPVARPIVKKD